jgi:hypothetical protein
MSYISEWQDNSDSSSVIGSLQVQTSDTEERHDVLSKKQIEQRSNLEETMGGGGEVRQEISRLKQKYLSKKLNNHEGLECKFDNIQA